MCCLHQDIFTRKVTDIAFTSDFCNNYSHPASPTSLCLTSPRPRPTRPRVPYLMSTSPSSRVPTSQVPTRLDVPVPLSPSHFYTQPAFYTGSALRNKGRPRAVYFFTCENNMTFSEIFTCKDIMFSRESSPGISLVFM